MEWFRWYHGAVSDSKWPIIAKKSGQPVGMVLSVWVALLEQASQEEERGSVQGFDAETIDALFGYAEGTTAAIVRAMLEKGMLENGCIRSWNKRQPKREDPGATERKRRQREATRGKVAELAEPDVRPCHTLSHSVTPEQNRAEQKRTDKTIADKQRADQPTTQKATSSQALQRRPVGQEAVASPQGKGPKGQGNALFECFVAAYPAGRLDGERLRKAWGELAASGNMPAATELLPALDAWKASSQWAKQGGQYIPLASNFMLNRRWKDPAPTPPQRELSLDEALALAAGTNPTKRTKETV